MLKKPITRGPPNHPHTPHLHHRFRDHDGSRALRAPSWSSPSGCGCRTPDRSLLALKGVDTRSRFKRFQQKGLLWEPSSLAPQGLRQDCRLRDGGYKGKPGPGDLQLSAVEFAAHLPAAHEAGLLLAGVCVAAAGSTVYVRTVL